PGNATLKDGIESYGRHKFVSDGTFPISMRGAYAQTSEALYGEPYFVLNKRELSLMSNYLRKAAPAIAAGGDRTRFEAFARGLVKSRPASDEVKSAVSTVRQAFAATAK